MNNGREIRYMRMMEILRRKDMEQMKVYADIIKKIVGYS